ncbi:MAG TPA: response regulator [Nitrospirae bacterium]|nr:response regulator [Nitrospirota bacterium]
MTKEKFIKKGLFKLTQTSISVLFPFGAFFLILLSVLDYFITPENFVRFLTYRLIAASFVMLFYLIFKLKKNQTELFLSFIIIIGATIVPASMVELMILTFGGHQSIYYAGMIVVIIFVLGFLAISIKMTVLVNVLIYAIYLIPIILFDKITNVKIFINNNVFLLVSAFGAFGWRYFHQRLIIKNLSLEYELFKERDKLKEYSQQLEETVQERTRDLRKSEAMLKTLFENANDGILIMDDNGVIVDANQRACESYDREKKELIGTDIQHLGPDTDKNKLLWRDRLQRLLNGEPLLFESEHYGKDENKVSVEISAKAIQIDGRLLIQSFHRDLTEKKRLQAQLLHSQKMESIGTLAGGIAHDFNNILTAILGYADLILMNDKLLPEIATKVRVIETSARQASQMVSKLLSFARRGSVESVPFAINSVIEDTMSMVSRLVPGNVVLRKELDSPIPPVEGDVSQIEQVLMNLIINAKDAMPDGGEIAIITKLVEIKHNSLDIPATIKSGEYIHIMVTDTGTGISERDLPHIFEPFYTTKEKGKGTGLGLAMVYGIIKEHGGYITVESRKGHETKFNIYLPISKKQFFRDSSNGIEKVTAIKTILAIDDEIPILQLIKEALSHNGFNVIIYDNPLHGLEFFKANRNKIDLVITDIVMPSMDGAQLIEQLRKLKPGTKIIATTGFSEDIGNVWIDGFLKKPFQSSKLLSVIRDVLDRGTRKF